MLIRANNGDVFDTDDAVRFDEQLWWNGYAMVGKFSYLANENCRQILFRVAGRYYLTVITPDNQNLSTKLLSPQDAAAWLLSNSHALPADLPTPPLVGKPQVA